MHRELAGAERDYLVLEYAKGDKLYVPSDAVGMVARYIGGDAPRVHRMGGTDWARATAKVKRAVRDMAGELVRLYTVRMSVPGYAFGPDTPWQHELEDAFPYEETPDQLRVIDEVKRDMERPVPMDRLLCGDVGFGKTEVAVRAAFKAVMEGKQVAVLVPTTLLAEQHLLTFRERFAPYPVTVRMLSRFVDAEEQQELVIADLAAGKVDVVIGTHRLLGSDVRLRGSRAAGRRRGAALRRLAQGAPEADARARRRADDDGHADPAHARDGAHRHPPDVHDRHAAGGPAARAHVRRLASTRTLAVGAVRRELLREGQVFWVHNRVATIDRQAHGSSSSCPRRASSSRTARWTRISSNARWCGSGSATPTSWCARRSSSAAWTCPTRTPWSSTAPTCSGWRSSTSSADGSGRSAERAFAYLFFPEQREMTEEAHVRLATIAQHQALGSGFKIAMRDLEIRGAGNLLGAEQSGHIAAVGFDAYARILQESVRELQRPARRAGGGAADRPAGEGVRPAGVARAGVAPPRALPADRDGARSRRRWR